ncbi:hypothetical protein WJX72_005707 [[Myrmecia] bisecta]|uniref:Methyltransferase type 11 domain-containing protein n=1 Tax=[Myrmecia] bisecta TaxID=41462 RepID=A0AAW1QQQ7_9CHLO
MLWRSASSLQQGVSLTGHECRSRGRGSLQCSVHLRADLASESRVDPSRREVLYSSLALTAPFIACSEAEAAATSSVSVPAGPASTAAQHAVLEAEAELLTLAYLPQPEWLADIAEASTSGAALLGTDVPGIGVAGGDGLGPSDAAAAVQQAYDSYAGDYDRLDSGASAEALGIPDLRQELLAVAYGQVLEVAVGTGLNLPLYDQRRVTSLIGIDISKGMLAQAAQRTDQLQLTGRVKLQQGNVEELPFAAGSFDCLVDTFSLCVFPNPSRALKEMARVVRPGGKVLLLEHSRSNIPPLGAYQDVTAGLVATMGKGCVYFKGHPVYQSRSLVQRRSRTNAFFIPQRQTSPTGVAGEKFGQKQLRTDAGAGLGARLREAVYQGLRLTSLAIRLAGDIAHSVVTEAQKAFQRHEAEQQQRRQADEEERKRGDQQSGRSTPSAPERLAALAAQQRDAVVSMSRRAADSGFIKMLHSLGDPKIPLEHKWADLGKHVRGGDEFSAHFDKLFQVAGESSKAMQELLSTSGDGNSSSSAFFKSVHTRSVIAEEEAFKALVFSQMLGAT